MQIRLSKPSAEGIGVAKPLPAETITVACLDHLVLADLPVAKSIGSASGSDISKTVGRRSHRHLGERVHFCVRCDFPIAIYGRLSPCDHAFCLDCARSDSLCYLCDERVQKIQTIKLMEGIFICAAPQCLKSFLNKTEFKSHVYETHADLVHPNRDREGNESEAIGGRKSSASESTVQAQPKPVVSPCSNSQVRDREHRGQYPQSKDQPSPGPGLHSRSATPFSGPIPSHASEQCLDGNQSQAFDGADPQNQFPQQVIVSQGGLHQDSGPINRNPILASPQFGYAPCAPDGTQQFCGTAYDMVRPESTQAVAPEAAVSQLGFPQGPAGALNLVQNYPQPPWSMGHAAPFGAPPAGQGTADGFANASDLQGRAFFQGDYGQNMGISPSNMPPPSSTTGNFMDPRLALPPLTLPPPSLLPPPHRSYSGDGGHDAPPGSGWQQEKRAGFGSGQD